MISSHSINIPSVDMLILSGVGFACLGAIVRPTSQYDQVMSGVVVRRNSNMPLEVTIPYSVETLKYFNQVIRETMTGASPKQTISILLGGFETVFEGCWLAEVQSGSQTIELTFNYDTCRHRDVLEGQTGPYEVVTYTQTPEDDNPASRPSKEVYDPYSFPRMLDL